MKLYLTRHGETEWNLLRRIQGRGDSPLTARGRGQARQQAAWLADKDVERVFSSPLGRALSTAQEIAAQCRAPLQVLDELAEFSYGRWEGLTQTEIRERDPVAHAARQADRMNVRVPNGECYNDVLLRSRRALDLILAEKWTVAVITAHDGINRAFLATLLALPPARMLELRHLHGLIYEIDLTHRAQPHVQHWYEGVWKSGCHPPEIQDLP